MDLSLAHRAGEGSWKARQVCAVRAGGLGFRTRVSGHRRGWVSSVTVRVGKDHDGFHLSRVFPGSGSETPIQRRHHGC